MYGTTYHLALGKSKFRKNFLGRPKPHLYRSEYVRHSILQWLRKLKVEAGFEEILVDI